MGFAVVADEVRNLARRSAQAAKDTAMLIEDSIMKSGEGSKKLGEVASSILAITEGAGKVKTLVDEVDASSREQAQGIEQISKSIAQMDQVTQKTAASAEESASASEELNAQSKSLMSVVEQLQSLVGARTERHIRPKPAVHRAPPSGLRLKSYRAEPAPASTTAIARSVSDFPLGDNEFKEF